MGVWEIGDMHFGCRSNNSEWIDILSTAHFDFILPTIQDNWKDGDIIIQVGDFFDNRQSLNLKVMDLGIKFAEELAKIGPVHIIAGNHDIFRKDSTDITSLDALKWIPNIKIYKEPACINVDEYKLFLMPWRKDIKTEGETLKEYQETLHPDYAFMHGTFSSTKYNKYVTIKNDEGGSFKSTEGYKRVYSGHIHWMQHKYNVTVTGCPYEITRGDADNQKGIFYLNLENNEETFYENLISPKHKKFKFEEFDKDLFKEIMKVADNNFIDVIIANSAFADNAAKFTKALNALREKCRNLEIQQYDDRVLEEEIVEETKDMDQQELITEAVNKRIPEDSRNRAYKIIDEIIKEIS